MKVGLKNSKGSRYPAVVIKFSIDANTRGFFSLFIESVRAIDYAFANNCTFKIDWTNNCYYSNSEKFEGNKNAWEYFLKNSETPKSLEVLNSNHLSIHSKKIWSTSHFRWLHTRVISKLVFQKAVRTNLDLIISKIQTEIALGVHIRRTDHGQEIEMVELNQIIKIVKKNFIKGNFKKVFISTDDELALQKVIQAIGIENCIYNDVCRSNSGEPIHKNKSNNNGYLLGLEALADVTSLSACRKVLLCNSNFSYAVMLFNPNIKFKVLRKEKSILRWLIFKTYLIRYVFFIKHLKYLLETKFFKRVSCLSNGNI